MVEYIIVGVIVVGLLALGGYFLAQYLKGRLGLTLDQQSVATGEHLTGTVTVEAKRPIRGLLKVSLVGKERRRSRSTNESGNTHQWVEVYRQDEILENTRDFPVGHKESYNFKLEVPTASGARGQSAAALREIAERVGDGALGSIMKVAAGAASRQHGRLSWRVESRLDAEGIDLATKRKIAVNLNDPVEEPTAADIGNQDET